MHIVSAPTAIVGGALAQRPGTPGHAWVFLNWVLGLRAIGFDVILVDRLETNMLSAPERPISCSVEWKWFDSVTKNAGLGGRAAVLIDGGTAALGISRRELQRRCEGAAVLFNIMGYLDDAELLAAVDGPRVFVDIDPGFPQMWHDLGLFDPFAGHDAFVTVGLGVGSPDSFVPTCERNWITTVPPVDLTAWPEAPARDGGPLVVSDVASWRGPSAPVEFQGVTYGLRVHEMRNYASLPKSLPDACFDLALAIDPDDHADACALRRGGWHLSDAQHRLAGMDEYRRFMAGTDVELTVAKQMYVRSQGGWFSDRSACYLASGRPVLAHDTGYPRYLPTGAGLMSFSSPDEAADLLRAIDGDRDRHRLAARRLAEEHFDACKVMGELTAGLGVSP